MAQDIVPIELSLPQGDLVTLWAPRWREDGEEWEAFLGHGDDLYAFPSAAELAAFVRTATEHDLIEHPVWHVVPGLAATELVPDEEHRFDLVGVPDLVAQDPNTWTLGELADTVAFLRSLADVCDLEVVHEILDSAEGFALLPEGTLPFSGREGERRWIELGQVVVERWDELLDAVDALVTVPEVDPAAVEEARAELAEEGDEAEEDVPDTADDFWAEVGIDPIKIITTQGEYYTLRCYLDDEPIFLGSDGRIDVFTSPRALARYLADEEAEHDLRDVVTWPEVATRATGGELEIEVAPENVYVLPGLADDLAGGPEAVDPQQLELAVELLTDAADWAGERDVRQELAPSKRLGWLVSFVLEPNPTRLAPSAPFDEEVDTWQRQVADFEDRLRVH